MCVRIWDRSWELWLVQLRVVGGVLKKKVFGRRWKRWRVKGSWRYNVHVLVNEYIGTSQWVLNHIIILAFISNFTLFISMTSTPIFTISILLLLLHILPFNSQLLLFLKGFFHVEFLEIAVSKLSSLMLLLLLLLVVLLRWWWLCILVEKESWLGMMVFIKLLITFLIYMFILHFEPTFNESFLRGIRLPHFHSLFFSPSSVSLLIQNQTCWVPLPRITLKLLHLLTVHVKLLILFLFFTPTLTLLHFSVVNLIWWTHLGYNILVHHHIATLIYLLIILVRGLAYD